jgi:hypothetical protein
MSLPERWSHPTLYRGIDTLRGRVKSNVERPARTDAMKDVLKVTVVAGGFILAFHERVARSRLCQVARLRQTSARGSER